ncbi:MAG: hypothetical protein FD124_1673 [Alphaproteobacteria bacterium]|nr:MAG: hypothetical protein FD160_723 [Caulobacteraceae bacterium]TPW06496.1 MAG: hypothetical protein FD124_1673 [Alphaproteobacteria bacterium]
MAHADAMAVDADTIIEKIRALENELEAEFAKQRAGLRFGLERGRVLFEQEVIRRHRALRKGLARYVFGARPLVVLTAPVIYSLIIPFALADLWVSAYQAICFRVYGIPQVKRSQYMIFDRAGLAYLNAVEKVNCAYCSYVNGVIAYVREVGSRTEQYWCPIKHARRVLGAHPRYAGFSEYGDADTYEAHLAKVREALRAKEAGDTPP